MFWKKLKEEKKHCKINLVKKIEAAKRKFSGLRKRTSKTKKKERIFLPMNMQS